VKQHVALQIASSPREAWDGVIEPWFRAVVPVSWKQELPSGVVVPTRAHAHALKQRLVEEGYSELGIQFVTPAALRDLLGDQGDSMLPLREHLRFLLGVAAQELNDGENLAAKAVVRAPEHLLRAIDRLETAGWNFESAGPAAFHPIVRRFREQLRNCHFSLPGEFDRRLLEHRSAKPAAFTNLLVAGFDSAHWPRWHLLRAAVRAAERATVVLDEPRGRDPSEFEYCWIGSWEEAFGEAKRVTKRAAISGDSLFSEAEMRGEPRGATRFDFLIATNAAEQAHAIAAQCLHYLIDEKCTRLAVVFSSPGALPRLVADALAIRGILHNDGFAHPLPGIFEAPEWQAWLDLQAGPRLDSFLRFLNALPDPTVVTPNLNRSVLENILRESWAEVLLDDLQVLAEFCQRKDERFQAAGAALRAPRLLPARATLSEFLNETETALIQLGWEQQAFLIANLGRNWSDQIKVEIPRGMYLRWIGEAAASTVAGRAAAGDHPYARVQLLGIPEAQNQEWSHLIVAGCNEGNWPPPASSEFARVEEIRAFNQRIQQLNKRAAKQGIQGEGHTSVRAGHSLYLGPVEQRAIAVRQLDALFEATSQAVSLTASLVQEDAPERLWNPSETLTESYRATRGEPLTQVALKALHHATTQWLEENRPVFQQRRAKETDTTATLLAFARRRDPASRAGEYDFGLRRDESYRPIPTLSVSDLETMVSAPAIVWMKRYLGVEAPDDTSNPWATTSGKWVHLWLASVAAPETEKVFAPFPSALEIDERVQASANERRALLGDICQSLGKIVPDWWISGWLNARYLARHLGGKIAGATDWKWMQAEYGVGRDGVLRVANGVELQIRGRIDLVLAKADRADFTGQTLWIVDYKTGSTKELKDSDLHDSLVKGTALQLGLYALALRALGAADVGASILSSAVRKVAPQLFVADLAPHTAVFTDLAAMQQTGVFGMKGELRPAFGYSPTYPLAMLPIDEEILEDKWQRSHENLVLEKEEWEKW
jgi:PD-(D/E)XK nuclease superfamily